MDVKEALQILKNHGYKYTGKREEMVRIFDVQKRYLTAKDMLEYMQADFPQISFDTIYRNIALFQELGILEWTQLENERMYRLSCATHDHHHHLICTSCGKTKQIDLCPMNAVLGEPEEFTITGHKFEIYGFCQECVVEEPVHGNQAQ